MLLLPRGSRNCFADCYFISAWGWTVPLTGGQTPPGLFTKVTKLPVTLLWDCISSVLNSSILLPSAAATHAARGYNLSSSRPKLRLWCCASEAAARQNASKRNLWLQHRVQGIHRRGKRGGCSEGGEAWEGDKAEDWSLKSSVHNQADETMKWSSQIQPND